MKIIGITGPTGAGKTTALRVLGDMGVRMIDADAVYYGLLAEDKELKEALVRAFGASILNEKGGIDRKKVAKKVYPDRLEELNALTHPAVVAAIDKMLLPLREEGQNAAIDAIALVESGLALRCDVVVAVLAPLELRVARIMARDGIDESYARRRVLAQKPEEFFRERADYVLENRPEDAPEDFEARARALFGDILRR